ncbi:MAG: hypothetical protein IJI84_05975 [Clostridia bacterium]|nr:hypothetical protein [Clostridia bacterium]
MNNQKSITALSANELENISGGEVQQYRSILNFFMKRFRVINDMTGTVAISGIKDFNEALELNEKLNSNINQSISKEDKSTKKNK